MSIVYMTCMHGIILAIKNTHPLGVCMYDRCAWNEITYICNTCIIIIILPYRTSLW